MGRRYVRHNAKARASSVLKNTKKNKLHKQSSSSKEVNDDGFDSYNTVNPDSTNASNIIDTTLIHQNESGSGLIDSIEYHQESTENPLVIVPDKNSKKRSKEEIMDLLPEAPSGKMNTKKMKRLEKFIEKEIKKEERKELFKSLLESRLENKAVLSSSKSIGRQNVTVKESLQIALAEQRAGIPLSNPSVPLMVEQDTRELKELDRMEITDVVSHHQNVTKNDKDNVTIPEKENKPQKSILQQAFNYQTPYGIRSKPQEVTVVVSKGNTTHVEEKQTVVKASGFGKVSFGTALKKKETNKESSSENPTTASMSKRALKRQEKKQKQNLQKQTGQRDEESNSDSDESSEDDDGDFPMKDDGKQKNGWASNVVEGEEITNNVSESVLDITRKYKDIIPERQASPDPDEMENLSSNKPVSNKPAFYVPVNRPEEVELSRVALPVVAEEQRIMEAIQNHDVVILCGETGSGKTTQVPQFLYEAGFGDPEHSSFKGMVGITQPRRVAAVSMAKRVAEEMNLNDGQIAYQVRYDSSTVNSKTRIKFMTDGILLRELSNASSTNHNENMKNDRTKQQQEKRSKDILLAKYSCIIIDEAHERTIGTDVLIGWLTRIAALRNAQKISDVGPLKLIIMSATLRVEDFVGNNTLFPLVKPPVLKVDGRQYKVTIHYNKVTPSIDYLSDIIKKIIKIHTRLPRGGILVFLTGQREIQSVVSKLKKLFPSKMQEGISQQSGKVLELREDDEKNNSLAKYELVNEEPTLLNRELELEKEDFESDINELKDDYLENDNFDQVDEDDEEEDLEVLEGQEGDDEDDEEPMSSEDGTIPPLHVLPLYSMLSTNAQMEVFHQPPEGSRLCVIATNVAETSLTIPGIKYVIDCGKVKEEVYDEETGSRKFRITWTSKASADQRAGRAGRMGPGHSYRIFSSAVYQHYFRQFSEPEILRVPVDGVALQMKAMGINQVINFPFPTPPDRRALQKAEKCLLHLGALKKIGDTNRITALGKWMAALPVAPRFAKILALAAQQKNSDILMYMINIVAGLTVGNIFVQDDCLFSNKSKNKDKENQSQEGDDADAEGGIDGIGDEEKEKNREKRRLYYKIMTALAGESPSSDAVRMLRAIGAFQAEYKKHTGSSKDLENFCECHFLRFKSLDEIQKLKMQLVNILKSTSSTHFKESVEPLDLKKKMLPPKKQDIEKIKQLLFAGYVDQVALLNTDIPVTKYNPSPVYTSCYSQDSTDRLMIHPTSTQYISSSPPKFIIYESLSGKEEIMDIEAEQAMNMRVKESDVAGYKKYWMKGITIVPESWLTALSPPTMVNLGQVLETPEPKYDVKKDTVIGFVHPTYGPKSWTLSIKETELPSGPNRCMWFAKLLLQGRVPLTEFMDKSDSNLFSIMQSRLLIKPTSISKTYSRTNPRVSGLLSAFQRANVGSKKDLLKQFESDPEFLLKEYIKWIPLDLQSDVASNWPGKYLKNPKGWKLKTQNLLNSVNKYHPSDEDSD